MLPRNVIGDNSVLDNKITVVEVVVVRLVPQCSDHHFTASHLIKLVLLGEWCNPQYAVSAIRVLHTVTLCQHDHKLPSSD